MRRALLFAALVSLATSCGGSAPAAPTTVNPPPAAQDVRLVSGPYTLALTLSPSGIPVCQNSICVSVQLCIGTPSPTSALYPVMVVRDGDRATVSMTDPANSLTMGLQISGTTVQGTISGSARDAAGVAITVSGVVTGATTGTTVGVSGNIDGTMSVAGGACSNNGHGWSLTPR